MNDIDIRTYITNVIPRHKKYKVYPTGECSLCNDISIVEVCPLDKCYFQMCGVCWNKIYNDFNNTCPTCRRNLPEPSLSCSQSTEKHCRMRCDKYISNMKVCIIFLSCSTLTVLGINLIIKMFLLL